MAIVSLSFISMCVSYVYNILLVIFPLYLLQFKFDRQNYRCYMIICCNAWSHKVACGTIQGYTTNKNYYYVYNVVCIQIVLHWDTNRECGIN